MWRWLDKTPAAQGEIARRADRFGVVLRRLRQ
jgi:hypothetical protein